MASTVSGEAEPDDGVGAGAEGKVAPSSPQPLPKPSSERLRDLGRSHS